MYTPKRNENCLPIGDPEFWSGKTNPEYSWVNELSMFLGKHFGMEILEVQILIF